MLSANTYTQQFLSSLENDAGFRLVNILIATNNLTAIQKYEAQHPNEMQISTANATN